LKAKWAQKPFVKQGFVDKDFEKNKIDIMKLCLVCKYKSSVENNTDFYYLLLSTGKENIIEVSKKDHFWGTKLEGDYLVGENMLGQCLMWLRTEIRKLENVETVVRVLINECPYLKTLKLCDEELTW
jgi:hypothetical protein